MATTSIGAPGVTFPDGTVQASKGASGDVVMRVYTSSSTWTKPATVKSIKVTVVGGGGNGGSAPNVLTANGSSSGGGGGASIRTYTAPSIPGPQPFTVGGVSGTSSFGSSVPVISATGGGAGVSGPTPSYFGGAGGTGSGGLINIGGGSAGIGGSNQNTPGGPSYLGAGGAAILVNTPATRTPGLPGQGYGAGGSGGVKNASNPLGPAAAGAGIQGVVIVEEFY
jgi:hypothetical protein